jgi:hypothetical protein
LVIGLSGETIEDQFEKFVNLGDDRNIVEVYVAGACVKSCGDFAGLRPGGRLTTLVKGRALTVQYSGMGGLALLKSTGLRHCLREVMVSGVGR